jgi:hypothetical protein
VSYALFIILREEEKDWPFKKVDCALQVMILAGRGSVFLSIRGKNDMFVMSCYRDKL